MPPSLIERETPLDRLRTLVERATVSHGGLVLVTGDAGIGKTTLVRRAADDAVRAGALVLRGACWDADSSPGYWPWTQTVRSLRRSARDDEWSRASEAAAGLLPVLLGEATTDEDVERFRLFDAVTSLLIVTSQSRPVLMVIEDLHRADAASLSLLEFAAQHAWYERLLLIGTYRDTEVERPDHPLRPLLGPLTAKATTIQLSGLTPPGVAELITRTAGRRPTPELVEAVHRRTGGNPFFVEESARLWSAGQPLTAVSPGVHDALRHRLDLISEPVVELLRAAAVLGGRFDPGVLATMTALTRSQVDTLLAEAERTRVVVPSGEDRIDFAHDLVRECLYGSLDGPRLRRLHAAAARALLAPRPTGHPVGWEVSVHTTELARHAYFAGAELPHTTAVELLLSAARLAAGRLASEEAAGHFRRALDRIDTGIEAPDPQRILVALELGLQLQLSGEYEQSWLVFADAATLARQLGDVPLLGRVALTLYGADGQGDERGLRARALRWARDLLAPQGTPVGDGARGRDDPAAVVARSVIAAARTAQDDEALRLGLWARLHAVWEPSTTAERVAIAGELTQVSRRRGDRWMELLGASMRWVALLEQGDPRFLDQFHALVVASRSGEAPHRNLTSIIDRSVVHALMGRFDEAAELLDEAVELTGRHPNYYRYFIGHQRWVLPVLQGRFASLPEVHSALRSAEHPTSELLLALTALERGERVSAPVPRPGQGTGDHEVLNRSVLPLWLRYQAQQAAAARDPEQCARARADLLPYEGQWLVSAYGWDISGPTALWVGLLDAAQERWDAAVLRFTEARRSAERLHARPWSARAGGELAAALLARGGGGDRERAAKLVDQVLSEAQVLGMVHIAARARELATATHRPTPTPTPGPGPGPGPGSTSAPAPVTTSAVPAYEFAHQGAVWRLRFDGRTVHMPDAKGLRDLHALLGQPGQPVPSVRLLNPQGGEVVVAAAALGGDPVLDEEAKARYRARLARLDEEIDRADALGDDLRAAEYDQERQALIDELRRAVGLGGRTRRLGDEAQRARKNVTGRIRDVLRRLHEHHPELATHLEATVSTGTSCVYAPEDAVPWRL
ncbi:AAA family ATPase [Streptomyces sp. NPDC059076]|uniref:AAA family ATPase n=1 Tax=unclassified Streptomyces TaxID=2593676 RepID=UPI00368CCAAF